MNGGLYSRVKRLKEVPFEESVRLVLAGHMLELAELPGWIRCPIHGPERTASLIVHPTFWYCHGACKAGGDALDLLQALEGLELRDAVVRLEQLLGLSSDAGEAALARALAENRPVAEVAQAAWAEIVEEIAEEFLTRVRPLLACPDPIVFGLAEGPCDHVFDELRDVASDSPPLVSRARRELLRELRRWSLAIAAGVERDAERASGRDRLDLALLSRAPILRDLREAREAVRPLVEALKLYRRREKQERKSRNAKA